MTYYYIMYVWRSTRDGADHWNYSECLTERHPVQWLVEQREKYSCEASPNKKVIKYTYAIIGWKEVSPEIYGIYKDKVG